MADDQHMQAEIYWRDEALPVSRRFDDPYFSVVNGLEETRHVFLAGNNLPARFAPGFHIGELGFGTGLNLLTACQCWRQSGAAGRLRYTSFEAYPMRPSDMARALGAFPALARDARQMIGNLERGETRFALDLVDVELVIGDARHTLPSWTGRADAWFLDGFAPAKNPELWEPSLLRAVAGHTNSGGSFATYSAAGAVRRSLSGAGFEVDRIPGFGRKRHMSRGVLRGRS